MRAFKNAEIIQRSIQSHYTRTGQCQIANGRHYKKYRLLKNATCSYHPNFSYITAEMVGIWHSGNTYPPVVGKTRMIEIGYIFHGRYF